MTGSRLTIVSLAVLFSFSAYSANPFLDAPGDEPVSATFRGAEWSDDIGEQEIPLRGDLCIYDATHPSGHFKKIVWKKGVGLVEYAGGYEAHADGYRLKRVAPKEKQ